MNIVGHTVQDGDLKTEESYRNIPMSNRLRNMLLNLKKERAEYFKSLNQKFNENDYVFLNSTNAPYVPERLQNKIRQIINKYNLEHMTVYGFRHTFATTMSEKGMDKEVLRELMGHSEFETTDFYYIHISEERKKREYARVNNEEIVETSWGEFRGKRKIREKG